MPQLDPIVRISTQQPAGNYVFDEFLRDRFVSMEFVDKASGADTMKLVFHDPDMFLQADERLAENAKLAVLFGYSGRVYADEPGVAFQIKKRTGFRMLTVEGTTVEVAAFLGRQRTRTWEDTTEWDVAEELAIGLGFSSEESREIYQGDYSPIRRGIVQAGETDWAFLERLASRVGCACYTSGAVFHFHPPAYDGVPRKVITYFDSLEGEAAEDPEIEVSPLGRAGRSTQRGVSTRERTVVSGSAGNSDDSGRVVLGDELALYDPGSWEDQLGLSEFERRDIDAVAPALQECVMPTTEISDEAAQQQARQVFRASERETVKLRWPGLVGDPDLKAGETIRIEGIGPRYSGNYFLQEVTHKIEKGYTTEIKTKRNALGRSGATATQRRQDLNNRTTDLSEDTLLGEIFQQSIPLDPWCLVNDSQPQPRLPVYISDISEERGPE